MNWLKWFLWTSRRCKHEDSHWEMRDMGMGKVRWCDDCGKCLELA